MSRCPHCKKLTHDDNLRVYYKLEDTEKVQELRALVNWIEKFQYPNDEVNDSPQNEIGKLKCGEMYIHFIAL